MGGISLLQAGDVLPYLVSQRLGSSVVVTSAQPSEVSQIRPEVSQRLGSSEVVTSAQPSEVSQIRPEVSHFPEAGELSSGVGATSAGHCAAPAPLPAP